MAEPIAIAATAAAPEEVDHHAHDIPLIVAPIATPSGGPNSSVVTLKDYQDRYAASIQNPSAFWAQQAKERLDWFRPFEKDKVTSGSFEHGDVTWFAGGQLNVCYNAVDRHDTNKIAILWEGDEVEMIRKITYGELQRRVCQIANALSSCHNVTKGDVVTIYMPMSTSQFPARHFQWFLLRLMAIFIHTHTFQRCLRSF
jgi:acetyl-CoA synthetase